MMLLHNHLLVMLLLCWVSGAAAQSTAPNLTPEQLLHFVPSRIKRYDPSENFKSREIKIGTLTYSFCEKVFVQKNKKIKILLFDYANAKVMFNQTIHPWYNAPELATDSVKQRHVHWLGHDGWESEIVHTHTAQVTVAIYQRFVLTIIGEGCRLSDLYEVLGAMDLPSLPH